MEIELFDFLGGHFDLFVIDVPTGSPPTWSGIYGIQG